MLAGMLDGLAAVLVVMGGADVVVVRLGGVQVVVVGIGAAGCQALSLPVLEDSEAGADLHIEVVVFQGGDDPPDAIHVPVRRAATRGDEADALGPGLDSSLSGGQRIVVGEPGVAEDVGGGAKTLGAVETVLRALARLQVDQVVDFHGCAMEVATDTSGGGNQFVGVLIGQT